MTVISADVGTGSGQSANGFGSNVDDGGGGAFTVFSNNQSANLPFGFL